MVSWEACFFAAVWKWSSIPVRFICPILMRQVRYRLCWAFCIYPVSLVFLVGSLHSAWPSPPFCPSHLLLDLEAYWTLRIIFFLLVGHLSVHSKEAADWVHDTALQEDVFLCFYNKFQCYRQQTGLLYKSRHTCTGSRAQTPNPSSLKHKGSSHA